MYATYTCIFVSIDIFKKLLFIVKGEVEFHGLIIYCIIKDIAILIKISLQGKVRVSFASRRLVSSLDSSVAWVLWIYLFAKHISLYPYVMYVCMYYTSFPIELIIRKNRYFQSPG